MKKKSRYVRIQSLYQDATHRKYLTERTLTQNEINEKKSDTDIKDNEEKVNSGDLVTVNEKVNIGKALLNSKV